MLGYKPWVCDLSMTLLVKGIFAYPVNMILHISSELITPFSLTNS